MCAFVESLDIKTTHSFEGIVTCVFEFRHAVVVDLDDLTFLRRDSDAQWTRWFFWRGSN